MRRSRPSAAPVAPWAWSRTGSFDRQPWDSTLGSSPATPPSRSRDVRLGELADALVGGDAIDGLSERFIADTVSD